MNAIFKKIYEYYIRINYSELFFRYGILICIGIIGLGVSLDIANIMVIIRSIGFMSVLLLFSTIILDDREKKGLFPAYDEFVLIQKAKENPIASAIVVATKNLFVLVIIILSIWFLK